jgi:hypothetical protein
MHIPQLTKRKASADEFARSCRPDHRGSPIFRGKIQILGEQQYFYKNLRSYSGNFLRLREEA